MRNKKILIVDDLKLNRITFAEILKDEYDAIEAENGKEALELLAANRSEIAAVILDLIMPVMDGFEFLEEFRKNPANVNLPVIVSTTNNVVETEERCLELGAWDFIPKTFHREVIRFRVRNAIYRSKQHLLEYDNLTGIYNRQMFYQKTHEMLEENPEETFAFIRFDIDRFKMINSFYGIAEGDRLLKYVAGVIRQAVKSYDLYQFGRINADVFGICIGVKDSDEAISFAQSIHEKMKKYENLNCYLETCAGCYMITDNSMEPSEIYDKATIAAKECKGKYMVHEALYTEKMGEQLWEEQQIVNEMDRALREEQFVVYFQPKYELEHYSPQGAEALVRWKKPDGTMVSPGKFIPVFEKNGFVIKLDYYVWEKVCQFIQEELKAGREPQPISVNVSRVNLYNPKFLESLIDLVEKYRIPPRYLYLELTESVFSDVETVILRTVESLHKVGFTILMDDFGSGYSSLNVLKNVQLDVLKIDMKFMSKGGEDKRGSKIIEAVIKMAESLKMPVIAEGVEEKQQVEMLKALGCDYIQGYYFSKPIPMEEYRKLIHEQA